MDINFVFYMFVSTYICVSGLGCLQLYVYIVLE
jgi:hypothetical protein